jgi:SnoaL-like domain
MSDVKELQLLDLEQMNEREAHEFLTELLSNLSPEEEYSVRHPDDYVLEMPQSGERILGRERMRRFQESYFTCSPSDPMRRIRVSRVLVRGGLWVVEGVADYDDGREALNVVLILELRDGKMWRDRWYFAGPFEAPQWRAQWVEREEPRSPTPGPTE